MATTVGSHSVSTFATPVNGGPLDANVVRGNDNTIRTAYVSHDADTGIHVQSSTLASRPSAGTAGRKWITADTGSFKLWYDDGTTWHEVGAATIDVFVLAGEALVKGDIVKVTSYNVGNGAPVVAKMTSASDVAFGIVNGTIMNGAVGYITNTGLIADVATNAFSIGDILYPNTSGGLTATKPTSGNYQPVAYVLRSNANNGVLYVEFSAPRIVERSDNTASTIVLRDASGNFAAGTITAGAVTSTGLVTFASLKGTGATTVTNIINDGTMATASATTLATSSSIKTYVDAQVATVDTLAEVLANGNTTGANNIIVTSGQKVTTNTIDETTSGSGVTIDSVLLKDDIVNATDIETGTLSANDGTQSATIANSTGVMTIASSVLTTTDINGGTVDGVTIGGAVAGAATFTNVTASGTINLTGATVSNGGTVTTIDINGGTIDGTTIGGASAAAGTFTTINATSVNATTFDMTNLEVTNIKAKDGTASMTIADTTGDVTVSTALVANGNVTLGNATSDTITVGGSFPTGTKLRTAQSVGNTLAVSAYDVDGTAYVDLVTATASNTPTLALTSTGVGSMNNIAIGGTTPAAGAFTTVDASGDVAVATNKFTVTAATGNTAVAGTLTTAGTLTSNGNTVIGSDATDTITASAQFVTGTQLKSAQSSGNTLALAAYDVDGTAYTSLVTLTAGNTPTLTMTSVGTGSLDNITIGGSTAAAGTFTAATVSGNLTLGADVVLSRGAANRLDLASGDSLNVVSGDYQIGGTSVLSSNTLGSGVTASSLTSVGTLSSLTVSGATSLQSQTTMARQAGAAVNILLANRSSVSDIATDTAGTIRFLDAAQSVVNLSIADAGNVVVRGDLTVDTSTLKVDSTNNRVGIGLTNPGVALDVSGASGTTAATIRLTNTGTASGDYAIYQLKQGSGSTWQMFTGANSDVLTWGRSGVADYLYLTNSGNLGLGVTPSAWNAAIRSFDIKNASVLAGTSSIEVATNAYFDTDWKYKTTATASRYGQAGDGTHKWYTAPSGTAGNTISFGDAKMTLDASGNLGVGPSATSPQSIGSNYATVDIRNTTGGGLLFGNSTDYGYLYADSTSTNLATVTAKPLTFLTNNTERARITSGGNLLVGTTTDSGYHRVDKSNTSDWALVVRNTSATTPWGLAVGYSAAAPNNTSPAISFSDNAAERATIRNNGGLANYQANDVNLSDERVKTDIKPVGSYWDKLKAIEIVTFKYIDQTHDDDNIGVIAQQIEAVAPEFIDVDGFGETPEDGVPLKTVYTTDLYHASIKALQEAMARIEALEARLAVLEA